MFLGSHEMKLEAAPHRDNVSDGWLEDADLQLLLVCRRRFGNITGFSEPSIEDKFLFSDFQVRMLTVDV